MLASTLLAPCFVHSPLAGVVFLLFFVFSMTQQVVALHCINIQSGYVSVTTVMDDATCLHSVCSQEVFTSLACFRKRFGTTEKNICCLIKPLQKRASPTFLYLGQQIYDVKTRNNILCENILSGEKIHQFYGSFHRTTYFGRLCWERNNKVLLQFMQMKRNGKGIVMEWVKLVHFLQPGALNPPNARYALLMTPLD